MAYGNNRPKNAIPINLSCVVKIIQNKICDERILHSFEKVCLQRFQVKNKLIKEHHLTEAMQ